MCQEIHLSDFRWALLDYCDEDDEDDEHLDVEDLLSKFYDDGNAVRHVAEHANRAKQLVAWGDEDGAAIHGALLANLSRAGSPPCHGLDLNSSNR